MIKPIKLKKKRVLIDVDTQKDMFLADGKYCIRNHRRVLMNIRRVMAWARKKKIKMVSTSYCRPSRNFDSDYNCAWQKISYTLLKNHIEFTADDYTDLPRNIFAKYNQIVVNKRNENPFQEPRAERLLSELRADEFVVIGALAEEAVCSTVLGLLQRGKQVVVIVDAVGTHDRQKAEIALRKMKAKGAMLVETKDYAGTTHLKNPGICRCKLCCGQEQQVKTCAGA